MDNEIIELHISEARQLRNLLSAVAGALPSGDSLGAQANDWAEALDTRTHRAAEAARAEFIQEP